jgi:hypothetical protein
MNLDEIKKGSFVIEKQKHLQEFSNPALRFYGATLFAGQAGRILGKFRKQEVISNSDKISQFGADIGIYDGNYLFNTFLPEIEKNWGCIDIYRDKSGSITKIEENIDSESDILKIVSEIWENRDPSLEEQASLEVLDYCSSLPRVDEELKNHISSAGYRKQCDFSIGLAKTFHLINEYKSVPGLEKNVYYTPLFARENVISISNKFSKLPAAERDKLESLLSSTKSTEANPLSRISIDPDSLAIYNKLGLIDITTVETIDTRKESFLFTPAIWGPLGSTLTPDEQEHVRALLSCTRLGQISPTLVDGKEYKIKNPSLYIAALKRRGRVGPSTPIGTDYVILEREGIVEIKESDSKPGQFYMILVKDDIAERARRIITRGRDISFNGEDEEEMRPLNQVGSFVNPVQSRIRSEPKLKRTGTRSELIEKEMMKIFRGEKD